MTTVAFHFNAPDKLAHACRLVADALRRDGPRIVVCGAPEVLARVDQMLWGASATAFPAHCFADAPEVVLRASPVVLAADPRQAPARDLLLQLGDAVPEEVAAFRSVVEVVDAADAADRARARDRWRHYAQAGHAIERLDLAAPEK